MLVSLYAERSKDTPPEPVLEKYEMSAEKKGMSLAYLVTFPTSSMFNVIYIQHNTSYSMFNIAHITTYNINIAQRTEQLIISLQNN